MAVRQCSAAHCSGADAELNEICKGEGWPVGHPVLTRDANGPCTCTCSCLSLGTPIEVSAGQFKPVEHFQVGDSVLAADVNLQWVPTRVAFSNGTSSGVQPLTIFIEYEGGELIVTPDHLFLLPDGRLTRADRLSPNDELVSPDGSAVKIRGLDIGTYVGGLHHIATTTDIPKDLGGHLLNTNGVVSADYAVQLTFRQDDPRVAALAQLRGGAVMGSSEYVTKFGPVRHTQPGLKILNNSIEVSQSLDFTTAGKRFIPIEHQRISIPADAVPFISDEEAERIRQTTTFRDFTDPLAREWTEYVLAQYRSNYPDIEYQLDWANNTVNAYAWISGGRRYVAILGGLVRHPALELEGIALVTAHETGHHYGGAPYYPGTTLSCEGQADFFGVRSVMRRVWFGEFYITVTTRAIHQMAQFFGAPDDTGNDAGPGGCQHPPGACRIFTYNAAVDLARKPACAG